MIDRDTAALVIVDVQRDFLPGGALGVDDGDEIVQPILTYSKQFDYIVATMDWHPPTTAHFERWPVHCVGGTPGAELHPDVPWNVTLRKGTSAEDDGYSGFEGRVYTKTGGESLKTLDTLLRQWGVKEIHVVGLALDYCVKATALDGAKLGYRVVAPLALTRPVDPTTGAAAIMALREAGVRVLSGVVA